MEEGRQQRALSPCVIWTRQEYALMFPMVEISVLFFLPHSLVFRFGG